MSTITTKDANGHVNGWLDTIWNVTEEPELQPAQAYLTTVLQGYSKGPHLHMKRRGMFVCVQGSVDIIVRDAQGQYETHHMSAISERLIVPPGCAAEIVNVGSGEATVLNMPSPAWTKEDPDDWPVEGWNPPCTPSTTTA